MGARLLRLAGLLLMLSAVAIALSRAPDRPVESLVARWAPPPSDFIDINGQLVHLRDVGPRGDPVPLLLLHGTAASLHTWDGWMATLGKTRRVISVDLPGFGLTGPFAGRYPRDDYSAAAYVRFVLDLMDALKLQRVVVAGNSLGGEVAWRAVLAAPQRFERLVLVDATGYGVEPESVPLGFLLASLPIVNRIGEHLLPRALIAQSVIGVYGDPARVTEGVVDRYFELALREGNRRALGLRLRQRERGEDVARIKALALPTLVLWGGRDRLVPPAAGRRFAADIAGAQLVVFDELGHVPQEEDPARTVQPVLAFLQAAR